MERIVETFIELVKIDSEAKNEGKFQKYLKEQFEGLGLKVIEDDTMGKTGLGANNLLCQFPGDLDVAPIFFSAHVDTVTPGVGIQPEIRDGVIYSDGTTILAADDKAGIAVMLELVKVIQEENIPHGLIEFVLTPGEEIGLVGVSAFDVSQLQSAYGFVLDNGGPVGSITMASPTLMGLEVEIIGETAHAGLEPEKGVSAIEIAAKAISEMTLGRLDEETTANIGTIAGGTATNIVADNVIVTAEARSISRKACEKQMMAMVSAFEDNARQLGGKVNYSTDIKSIGYRFSESDPVVQLAAKAIEAVGRNASYDVSGGGSDANVFNAKGKKALNLSVGYEEIHTLHEYIAIDELLKALELAVQLVKGTN
ncbi:M20/M25/M40 family metallo-hydrolase [Vagococcus sp. BWB3-3]|uniref:M20/M25/M40 family metallo-hydrolase n=1 Tax=Vagococcus allomyrinae TaxID=2794353 RepID=A0A940PJU2_9ENTE|nr:M20/M25/M40 family metallo-hydrolase [Vagococcus allomyrinae]MBP1044198.1 M20/M25/M40 family metallo-hydrolase [Vagococcus allomyrinae]